MSYVDALHSRDEDEIRVVERVEGKRIFKTYPARYVFYYTDKKGKNRTIFGDQVQKFTTTTWKIFQREQHVLNDRKIFESDISPIFRCLAENYSAIPEPDLHITFLDIEVAFDPEKGFSTPDDAFSPITAISLNFNWVNQLITLVCKPDSITQEEAEKTCKNFSNCFLCSSEKELLELFLKFIDDTDVLSGWNSTGFDIPYIHNRIIQVLGKDYLKMLCLWDEFPRKRTYTQYKTEKITYDLVGRVHLDYLELYRKHNTSERLSHRLDFIAEQEVGEKKIPYEGTLDNLYKNDFSKFIEYNRQDVMLLVKIDQKLKFISLSNQMAHTNTVLLKNTLGSVALIDQAIINEAHRRDLIVPNRKSQDEENELSIEGEDDDDEEETAAGAYVADPKIGLHEWIGGVDISSLYPSTIRAFNMGPETLIGQIRHTYTNKFIQERLLAMKKPSHTRAWEGVFNVLEYDILMNKEEKELTLDLETGEHISTNGKELYELIFNEKSQYCVSANGTIFRLDIESVIAGLLSKWYSNRKTQQKKAKDFNELMLKEMDPIKKEEYKKQAEFWDQRQYATKILLNSLYGAILNPGSRFYDHRIGQSVTLSGRSIDRHMGATINQLITGEYDYKGDSVYYADTDSIYFSSYKKDLEDKKLEGIKDLKKYFIKRYNEIAKEVNSSFPGFMKKSFGVPEERGTVIQATRELASTKGIFITKKRYAVLIYDKENKRKDIDENGNPLFDKKTGKQIFGEIKAMGLDTKRSDTPKAIQEFLEEIILMVLTGGTEGEVINFIKEYRVKFRNMHGWEKGTPKKVNALTKYAEVMESQEGVTVFKLKTKKDKDVKKLTIPGHVRSSLAWNRLRKIFNDNYSIPVMDGSKVIVCKLLSNNLGLTSVAYPVDEPHLPDWFRDLPFDHDGMEQTIIDKKIQNLIGVLNWNLKETREDTTFNKLFDF